MRRSRIIDLKNGFAALVFTAAATLTNPAAPAHAADWTWINEGGPAKSPDAISVQWFLGDSYEVVRGYDNQIWWRYRGGDWRIMPYDGRTVSRPEAVTVRDNTGAQRLAVFIVGNDGNIWYSFLRDAAGNSWTLWDDVPGSARAWSGVTAVSQGNEVALQVTADGRVYTQTMQIYDNAVAFPYDGWRPDPNAVVGQARPTNVLLMHGLTSSLDTWVLPANSGDLWVSTIQTGHSAYIGNYRRAPYGGSCLSMDAGRGGPNELSTNTSDPNYRAQQNLAIGCVSPVDHQLWVNTSTNAGSTFAGWSRITEGAALNGTPEVHGSPDGQVFVTISEGSQGALLMRRVM
ncbi:hypothetical protein Kpho02_05400 [Kitasatospora phosalacinea]|uniref:Uncharacterized protein n=1 Tax=Kitasatospora phosalacinea TaxID=2065 RepID=A0A9W6Q4A5_9ACTN|nr:hypothetical protein [Kitasatospora phosalacinea]GLW68241.1 hypothetical protein Kpho02_05400 [Kitasatospora phosalacinea]